MSESKHRNPLHIVYPNMWPSIAWEGKGKGKEEFDVTGRAFFSARPY